MEQTDYSAYEPMMKKTINTNDFNKVEEKMTPKKPITDINYSKDRNKKPLDYKNAKQSQLTSAFDVPREAPPKEGAIDPASSPVKARYPTQNKKL